MKGINARAALISLFLGLAVVTSGQAEEYYFYQTPTGALVISNKEPPPGSKIIKQLPGLTDKEAPQAQAQEPGKTLPTAQTEGSPKPFQGQTAMKELTINTASYLLIGLLGAPAWSYRSFP